MEIKINYIGSNYREIIVTEGNGSLSSSTLDAEEIKDYMYKFMDAVYDLETDTQMQAEIHALQQKLHNRDTDTTS